LIDDLLDLARVRMQQLLSNLPGNALHHGAPDQPVDVDVAVSSAACRIRRVLKSETVPLMTRRAGEKCGWKCR
jgi:hypothetical protein